MFESEIKKIETSPVLFTWGWSAEEWDRLVDNLTPPIVLRPALLFGLAITGGVGALRIAGQAWRGETIDRASLLESAYAAAIVFGLATLSMVVINLNSRFGNLVPTKRHPPICTITTRGVRLGNKVIFWDGRITPIRRVEPAVLPGVGNTIKLVQAIANQSGEIEVNSYIPVPADVQVPLAHIVESIRERVPKKYLK